MLKNTKGTNDYTFSRVPMASRASFLSVSLIQIGMASSLSKFMLAAILGHGMTFWQAMLATFLGSCILQFLSLGLGIAGMREGLSTSLLARWCGFGRIGSALIGVIISFTLIGWFSVHNRVLAEGLLYAINYKIDFSFAAAFCGATLTFLVSFGFKALSSIAKLAVPLFFAVVGWLCINSLKNNDLYELIFSLPRGVPLTLGDGVALVCGGFIIGAFITPDLSRYCQNDKHVFWMITLSIIIGEFIINAVTILIAHALGTSDVVSILTQSAGWIGFITLILSAVKINDINLYSSSLGFANTLEFTFGIKNSYKLLAISLGTIGTVLSMTGVLDDFIKFVKTLGVIFPPVLSVMLVDYYILRTDRKLLDRTREEGALPDQSDTKLIGWRAIIACILGAAVGFLLNHGIPSLNSIVSAGLSYWLLAKLRFNKISPKLSP